MSRYIDADALDIVYEDGDMTCVRNLDAMPTVDAVQVVRCRECKYHEDEELGMVYCPHLVGSWVAEDFYCADGERRTDGNE